MLRAPITNAQWHRVDQLWFSFVLALALHLALLGVNGLWPDQESEQQLNPSIEALSADESATDKLAQDGLVNRAESGNLLEGNRLSRGADDGQGLEENIVATQDSPSEEHFAIADAAGRKQLLQRQSPLKVYYSQSEQALVGFAEATQLRSAGTQSGSSGDDDFSAVNKQARVLSLGAASTEDSALQYVEGWRRWMRANGNLFYPAEARRLGLRGEVLTQVRLNSDGSLDSVRILRGSGQRLLDEAVLKTTREARWYLPFPQELAAEYEQLEFSWRWRYGSAN